MVGDADGFLDGLVAGCSIVVISRAGRVASPDETLKNECSFTCFISVLVGLEVGFGAVGDIDCALEGLVVGVSVGSFTYNSRDSIQCVVVLI